MRKIYIFTEEELKRVEVLNSVISGSLSLKQAQQLLGLSYRQTLRIKKRFLTEGFEGLLRRKTNKASAFKITQELKERILNLRKSLYWDFNILHFRDKLKEDHEISLSYESIRSILIEGGLHEPKKKRKVYRRRRRMPLAGMLVQMDSSQHCWIESVKEPWWLITMIDDADNFTYAEFHSSDNLWANMKVLKAYIEQRGIFMALYTDKASHFKTTRHGGLHYQVEVEQKETQIERALSELGIKLINANTAQAKGRIERKFRFFQDRLIKEMRLRGIKDYDKANKFLREEFLLWCNSKYSFPLESVYRSVSKDKDLELVFSVKHPRVVKKDNTVQYCKRVYQLLPTNGVKSFTGKWVQICELMNGRIEILWEGKRLSYKEITGLESKRKSIQEDEILNLRINAEEEKRQRRYTPSADHPWKREYKRYVTFYRSNKM